MIASQLVDGQSQHDETCTLCHKPETARQPLLYCRGCSTVCHVACLGRQAPSDPQRWYCAVCAD